MVWPADTYIYIYIYNIVWKGLKNTLGCFSLAIVLDLILRSRRLTRSWPLSVLGIWWGL